MIRQGRSPCLGQFYALLGAAYFHDSDFIDRAVDPEANPPPIELGSIDHAPICGADLIFHGCQWVFGQLLKDADNFAPGSSGQSPKRFGEVGIEDDLVRRHSAPLRFELPMLFLEGIQ